MTPAALYAQTIERIQAAMSAAMRADPQVISAVLGVAPRGADRASLAFLRDARGMTLGLSAALTTVLARHRYGRSPYEQAVCLSCGTVQCRTLRCVAEALAAYGFQFTGVDRAEAWRRAESWFAHQAGALVAVAVEQFPEGFIARCTSMEPVLIVDRRTGELTQWPQLPSAALVEHYRRYQQGRQ
jgi:hypothetical protein